MKNLTPIQSLATAERETVARRLNMPDLTLPFWGYRKKIPMHRIVRLEGEGNYTMFHFSDGTRLMVSLTLKTMETRLSADIFVRPHKKNIVNLLYLEDVQGGANQLTITLVNGDEIEVSRRKASSFVRQLNRFRLAINQLTIDFDASDTATDAVKTETLKTIRVARLKTTKRPVEKVPTIAVAKRAA
jgi:two-component system, LytTR family, response regulator